MIRGFHYISRSTLPDLMSSLQKIIVQVEKKNLIPEIHYSTCFIPGEGVLYTVIIFEKGRSDYFVK